MPIYIGNNPLGVFEVDFEVTSPQVDQYLKYDGAKWINSPLPQGQSPSGIIVVNSIASLRALTPVSNVPVLVTGYYNQGDGGGGFFFWDSTDNSKMLSSFTIANGGTGYVHGCIAVLNATDSASTPDSNRASVYVKTVNASTGAVTSAMIVKWGKYTTATLSNPITTTNLVGSGLTVNATWANLDNGGTIISSSVSQTGKWKRDFVGAISIKCFGATTTGDAQPAIQKAIAYNKHVFIPEGTYGINNAVVLFDNTILEGYGSEHSELYAGTQNIGNPIIAVNHKLATENSYGAKNVRIKKLGLMGYCTSAIVLCLGTYCILEDIRIHNTRNTDHALYCEYVWNTTIRNIHFTAVGVGPDVQYTPTPYTACFFIGKLTSGFSVENIVTSSTNPYGILFDSPAGYGAGQVFRNITVQGHTEVGFYIRNNSSGPTYVHGLYSEVCRVTMKLGLRSAGKTARAISLIGCSFSQPSSTNKGESVLWIDRCHGVDINGCTFNGAGSLDNCAILFNEANSVRMSGNFFNTYPTSAFSTFRMINSAAVADVSLIDQTTAAGYRGGQLIMRPNVNQTIYNNRLVALTLDINGSWVPSVLSIPIHASPPTVNV